MIGRLRKQKLDCTIETACAHCGEHLEIEIDSDLNYRVRQPGARPVLTIPAVNFRNLEDPSIIDAF